MFVLALTGPYLQRCAKCHEYIELDHKSKPYRDYENKILGYHHLDCKDPTAGPK